MVGKNNYSTMLPGMILTFTPNLQTLNISDNEQINSGFHLIVPSCQKSDALSEETM
jgi:hypothetical protein